MIKPPKALKKQRRSANKVTSLNFELQKIHPMTENQQLTFDEYNVGKNLVLHGSAGSGKSFLSLYLGLKDMLTHGYFKKIVIIRSAVATRDIGFLPGTEKEKLAVYDAPYRAIVADLFGRDDAYPILIEKGIIQFESTSFLRGLTYADCLIIVDECQNLSFHEFSTIITRLGERSRIIFAGDTRQSDFINKKEISGMFDFLRVVELMDEFTTIKFTTDDIVRSDIVKNYIITLEKLGL